MHNLITDELIRAEQNNPSAAVQELIKRLELVDNSFKDLRNDLSKLVVDSATFTVDSKDIDDLLEVYDGT